MAQLHPALGPPPQKFDFARRHMFRSNDSRRPVIVRHILVNDEVLVAKLLCHWRAWVWCRVLDVRPVDVLTGKCQIGLDCLACVVGTSYDQATDDEEAVAMEMLDRFDRRVPRAATLPAPRVLGSCLEKIEVALEDVLDSEKHITK